jgi:hypothetical protein
MEKKAKAHMLKKLGKVVIHNGLGLAKKLAAKNNPICCQN